MLDRLAEWKHRYNKHDSGGLERLLDQIAAERFTNPSDLIRLHETLLFLRAYPQTRGVAQRAGAMLANFSRRVEGLDAEAFQAPEASGIAGTSLTAVFSYGVARQLAERHRDLRIDWEAYDQPDRMGPVLRRIIPFAAEDWPVEAHPPFRQWVEAAAGQKELEWLLPRVESDSYDSMQLPLCWELRNAPHTRSRVYDEGALYYHKAPLLRRQDVALCQAFTAARLPVKRLPRREAERKLEAILDTSAVRYRELYGFTHPDAAFVYRIEAGRGVVIYWFGVPPEWRLPLRAYHAGMFFKNGVPAGYVEVLSLFDRAEIGFNLYYTFREGESAWIYARLLQLIHQMLGVSTFVVDPYQLGHENEEALGSGAFWFYRKLGFSAAGPAVMRLVEREENRMADSPGYRSSRATLQKLAAGHMRFEGPMAQPGAWDGFDWRKLGFKAQRKIRERPDPGHGLGTVPAMIPEYSQWALADRRRFNEILSAKRGPEESHYLRLMQRHAKLREAVLRLGSA